MMDFPVTCRDKTQNYGTLFVQENVSEGEELSLRAVFQDETNWEEDPRTTLLFQRVYEKALEEVKKQLKAAGADDTALARVGKELQVDVEIPYQIQYSAIDEGYYDIF